MSEHTPTPWHIGSTGDTELVMAFNRGREVILGEFGLETDTDYETDRANAAFIVKAVNSYDNLVAVLKEISDLPDVRCDEAAGMARRALSFLVGTTDRE